MAQASISPRAQEAKRMLDAAIENLKSVEGNLEFLEISLGPEAAVQALEEGQASVELRREDYDRIVAEESA